ncbi:MAG: GIY-YIG nuclease family protein [Alphaproteobacteria bacterium]|nr:GIY-YIG nuclease family protein [Alphaproteobacteria bacterium]
MPFEARAASVGGPVAVFLPHLRHAQPMYYVYLLKSLSQPEQKYVGVTEDLKKRFEDHNRGFSEHTAKYKPWELVAYHAFHDKYKAYGFEKYLKTGSGKAFANKRFW